MDTMLLLKVTALLSMTLVMACAVRRAAAATRHRLWSMAFVSLLALPLLPLALPVLGVPVPARWGITVTDERIANGAGVPIVSNDAPVVRGPLGAVGHQPLAATPPADSRSSAQMFDSDFSGLAWGPLLWTIVWLLGMTTAVAALLLSLLRARRLARTGEELADPEWQDSAARISARLGLRRTPRLLVSEEVRSPMAGGVWRSVIFLPPSIHAWNAERRDVVLAHEIAHLAGRDPLRHILARLAVAVYWFHPFVWIAAWQASIAREQACDEAVLALGTRPSVYARILLDLAELLGPPARRTAALSMVDHSLLEVRLMTILKDDARSAAKRRFVIPAIAVGALTLPLAAARPVARPAAADVAREAAADVAQAAAVPTSPVSPASAISPVSAIAARAARSSAAQTMPARELACSWNEPNNSSTRINNTERMIQQTFGDIRICLVAIDAGARNTDDRPSEWMQRARLVVIEARQAGSVQRLEIVRTPGAADQVSWQAGSGPRPFDANAASWRDRVVAVLDTTWEIATIRGQVSALRGEISATYGRQSALQGEISALRGEVSAMRGSASSARGEESALRAQVSAIRGRVSAMRGAISAERGAISAVTASRHGATSTELAQIAARVQRHEAEIARLEAQLRDYNAEARVAEVQKAIDAFGAASRQEAIEAKIAAFDLSGKVAAVQRRIADLDVQGNIGRIQEQIASLDADRRVEQLRERREGELRQLEAAISAIR
jgi:beta-lactamase regulating signal transducer with metallopeptidase domain